jgi:hypothetical protein
MVSSVTESLEQAWLLMSERSALSLSSPALRAVERRVQYGQFGH